MKITMLTVQKYYTVTVNFLSCTTALLAVQTGNTIMLDLLSINLQCIQILSRTYTQHKYSPTSPSHSRPGDYYSPLWSIMHYNLQCRQILSRTYTPRKCSQMSRSHSRPGDYYSPLWSITSSLAPAAMAYESLQVNKIHLWSHFTRGIVLFIIQLVISNVVRFFAEFVGNQNSLKYFKSVT